MPRDARANAVEVLFVECVVPGEDDRTPRQVGGTDAAGREWHLPLATAVGLVRRGVRFAVRRGSRTFDVEVVEAEHGAGLGTVAGGPELAGLPHCTHRRFTPPDPVPDEPPVEVDEQSALFRNCREALAFIRKNCPQLLPRRLEPGEISDPLPVDPKRATLLLGVAARQSLALATGRATGSERTLPRAVVWTDGGDELLVLLDSIAVETDDGIVTVGVDVACDELATDRSPSTRILVDLVVGTAERPTGVLAAAPPPRGHPLIVARWGDALVALAWQALLDASSALAAAAGADDAGVPLVPFSWSADRTGLHVAPRARHLGDRLAAQAVLP